MASLRAWGQCRVGFPFLYAPCGTQGPGTDCPPLQTEQSVTVLRGHEHNVRALSWSHEIPFHLYSGGWDGSFRIWDVR